MISAGQNLIHRQRLPGRHAGQQQRRGGDETGAPEPLPRRRGAHPAQNFRAGGHPVGQVIHRRRRLVDVNNVGRIRRRRDRLASGVLMIGGFACPQV